MVDLSRSFASVEFPAYEYREFPKWVTLPSGKKLLVGDRRDELAAIQADSTAEEEVGEQDREYVLAQRLEVERRRSEDLQRELDALRSQASSPHPDQIVNDLGLASGTAQAQAIIAAQPLEHRPVVPTVKPSGVKSRTLSLDDLSPAPEPNDAKV